MTFFYKLPMYLLLVTLVVSTACNNNDDDMDVKVEELLIGTWVTTNVDAATSIGGETVVNYLVNTIGFTPAEAAAQDALLKAFLVDQLEVTLTLYEDHTYESSFSGGMDSGTWSLSADSKTLTLIEGGEEIIVTINSITTMVMEATIADAIDFDIDNNSNTPDVTIDASADLTLEK